MNVQVTNKDINEGTRRSCCDCPLAKALKRTLKQNVVVGTADFFYIDEKTGEQKYIILPNSAQEFILNFDKGEIVPPFSFNLNL